MSIPTFDKFCEQVNKLTQAIPFDLGLIIEAEALHYSTILTKDILTKPKALQLLDVYRIFLVLRNLQLMLDEVYSSDENPKHG
jgi:hypothetical protein